MGCDQQVYISWGMKSVAYKLVIFNAAAKSVFNAMTFKPTFRLALKKSLIGYWMR